jgi:chromosome segregation protein
LAPPLSEEFVAAALSETGTASVLRERIAVLRAAYDAAETQHRAEIAVLEQELEALQAELAQTSSKRDLWQVRTQALAEQCAAAEQDTAAAAARAAQAEESLRAIAASTSWRLTAGLRRVAAWVKATGAGGGR